MDGKRRLPLWMVGASIGDRVSKSQDDDTIGIATKGEDLKPRPKGQIGRCKRKVCLPNEEAPEAEETSFLVKSETKRSKRRVGKDVTDCDAIGQEIGVEKTKRGRVTRKIQEPDHRRKKQTKNFEFEGSNEIEASSPDHDGDLTVDEMLSIAKEYVKDDSDVDQQNSSKGQCKYGTSPSVPKHTRHEEAASHHNSTKKMTSEVMLVDSKLTGDPAQDMLDLFLGPLLKKKPMGKEEVVSSVSQQVNKKQQEEDVILSHKSTKKKSSIRDTVAMLLE